MKTATIAYAATHAEILAKLELITQAVNDMDAPSSSTNWADVGDMQHLDACLDEIKARLLGEGEYA
jgi:hypothetical protein